LNRFIKAQRILFFRGFDRQRRLRPAKREQAAFTRVVCEQECSGWKHVIFHWIWVSSLANSRAIVFF
jgi:hypothetical protein